MQSTETDRKFIELAMVRAAATHHDGMWLTLGVGALIMFGGVARGLLWLFVIGLGFTVAMYALFRFARRKADPLHNPALVALRSAPETIVSAKHATASDSQRLFVLHYIVVRTATGADAQLRCDEDTFTLLAAALARHCPNARFDVPGFDPQHATR